MVGYMDGLMKNWEHSHTDRWKTHTGRRIQTHTQTRTNTHTHTHGKTEHTDRLNGYGLNVCIKVINDLCTSAWTQC